MKSFLAIFTCAENSKNHEEWKKLTEEAQKEIMKKGMMALDQWNEKYKNQVIFDGGPLSEMTKKVDRHGVQETPSQMGTFLLIQANSHEEAAKVFLDHPHFALFPGDGIDVLERLDQPRVV